MFNEEGLWTTPTETKKTSYYSWDEEEEPVEELSETSLVLLHNARRSIAFVAHVRNRRLVPGVASGGASNEDLDSPPTSSSPNHNNNN